MHGKWSRTYAVVQFIRVSKKGLDGGVVAQCLAEGQQWDVRLDAASPEAVLANKGATGCAPSSSS